MRIVIADSNSLVRIGLRTLLSDVPNIDIVGEVRSSNKLIECVRHFKVDVVVIDYTAKNFDIDTIPKILQRNPYIRFLAITPEQNATVLFNALRSGVYSYVKKDCDTEEIIDAVIETGEGKRFFCGNILETIQQAAIDIDDIDTDTVFSCQPIALSKREMQIIKMIAEGQTNTEIATMLCLSEHTINTHRKNVLAKLGVKNTVGIVMYAVKMNMVSPNKFLFPNKNQKVNDKLKVES